MSAFWDQGAHHIRFEWGLEGFRALTSGASAPAVFVIVDVLSFSTCVAVACDRGASVLPARWQDEGLAEYARARDAIVAGRRSDPAAAFSLSPASLTRIPAGTRLVLPSPNGSSLSFEEARGQVIAGCLRNARAAAERALRLGGPVAVIAAGERWRDGSLRPALEDLLGAGAVISHFAGLRSPEAEAAVAVFERFRGDLAATLARCASGRELLERGWAEDVWLAADLDVSAAAPVLAEGVFT